MSTVDDPAPNRSPVTYAEIERDPAFISIQRRQRTFVGAASAFFLCWYAAYVLTSSFARDFMATPVFGNVNVGVLFGFGQFASTFIITGLYIWFTNRRITPAVEELRARWEATR